MCIYNKNKKQKCTILKRNSGQLGLQTGTNSFLFGVLFSLQLEELLHAKINKT